MILADDNDDPFGGRAVGRHLELFVDRRRGFTETQLKMIVKKAQKQGWSKIYVYGPDGVTPNTQLAMQVQGMIVKLGMQDRMNCCLDNDDYAAFRSFKDVKKQCRANGGRKPLFDINMMPPILFNF